MSGPVRVFTQQIMGLPFGIHVRGDHPELSTAVDRVWADLQEADMRFSPYRSDSEVAWFNRGNTARSAPMTEMLALAEHARDRTHGAFDVYYGGDLEPCGLVKGWSAEKAAKHLQDLGVDFYLNAGGDLTVSAQPDQPWRLGIEHPLDTGGLLAVVEGSRFALATSGIAHRGQHIFSPLSAAPATGLLQVSVIGPDLVWADVLATAFIAVGRIDHAMLDEFPEYGALSFSDSHQVEVTKVMERQVAALVGR